MAQTFEIDVPAPAGVVVGGELTAAGAITAGALEHQLHEINALLDHVVVGEAVNQTAAAVDTSLENRLAQVRLGMANSLFTALRCRDAATAAHSLRVALGCSAWGMALKLPAPQLDAIEVAALLHDIGKIGVPDGVLLKPGALLPEERALMDRHVPRGLEILTSCCASADVLEMVRHAGSWYDGSRWKLEQRGNQLPLGARILAIVDAFDSMTTPQVYRPAMSRDRAIQELCDFAGSQFDPELVVKFAELNADDQQQLHQRVGRRWLHDLQSRADRRLVAVETGESIAWRRVLVRFAAPAKAAGKHVRRRDFPRQQLASAAMEPRGRTIDGNFRRQHVAAAVHAQRPEDARRARRRNHRRPLSSFLRTAQRRAIATAIDYRQPARPGFGRRHAPDSGGREPTESTRELRSCCTTPPAKLRWKNAATTYTNKPFAIRSRNWPTAPSSIVR